MSMVFMNYDIYYQSLGNSTANPRSYLEMWKTGGGVSDAMGAGAPISSIFSNADFDKAVNDAMVEFDQAKRAALLAEADKIITSSHIYVPILLQGGYYAVQDYVEGYVDVGTQDGYMFNHTTVKK